MSLEYFSQNIDILDNLNEEGFLPIAYLLALPSFLELKASVDDVVNAALESTTLDVSSDRTSVRFVIPVERKTIIVRDVPDDVTEEEIRKILDGFPVVGMKKEVASSWFITFPDETMALSALTHLHSQSLRGQPVKARVKSEFYRKELLHRIHDYEQSQPKRKMSSAATPFTMPEGSLPTGFSWGGIGLPNGTESLLDCRLTRSFGYYNYTAMTMHPNLPLVITAPAEKGYEGDFVHYSSEEINNIVRKMKDTSLPPLCADAQGLDIVSLGSCA